MDRYSRIQVSRRLKIKCLEMTLSGMSILCVDLSQFTSILSFMGSTQKLTAGHLAGPWNFSVSSSSFPKKQDISFSQINPSGQSEMLCFFLPGTESGWMVQLSPRSRAWEPGRLLYTGREPQVYLPWAFASLEDNHHFSLPLEYSRNSVACTWSYWSGCFQNAGHLCSPDSTLEHINAKWDPCILVLCADVNKDGLFFSWIFQSRSAGYSSSRCVCSGGERGRGDGEGLSWMPMHYWEQRKPCILGSTLMGHSYPELDFNILD